MTPFWQASLKSLSLGGLIFFAIAGEMALTVMSGFMVVWLEQKQIAENIKRIK